SDNDPRSHFQREYSRLQPDQRDALHRQITVSSGSSSRSSASSVQLQEIGTQAIQQAPTRRDSAGRIERHETAMERIETHRTQASNTVGASLKSRTRTEGKPLPEFGAGKPYPPPLPAQEEYVVEFAGADDPLHGQNWPMKKKLIIGAVLAFDSLCATMGSSIFSPATRVIAPIYGVSTEVTTLATSLFVLGYAFGPMIWAPMSELYGRKLPIVISAFGFGVFGIGVAVAKDLQTIIICRFFAGFFGSAPLALVGAVFADIFSNEARGLAIAVFAATVFMGPFLAPFIGGFITTSYLGWRWTSYLSAIMGFTGLILVVFFVEESYPPVILVAKGRELRRRTKNWGIHAKQDEVEVNFRELVSQNISRPFRILFLEPIVLLVTIYLSFIYGLLYLFLTAYALVFQGVYHFNPGISGLTYFGMIGGVAIGFCVLVYLDKGYKAKLRANNNIPVPEWRLPYVIGGGLAFAVGLFWFGWTGYTGEVHWIVPTLSGLSTGCGIYLVFVGLLNYLIDAYLML
ncbi:MAG: MFS transporter, partial [Terriglobus roseus]|nr:MFS transporter [Terriglobus roseus]